MSRTLVHVKLGIKPFSANKMHFMTKKRDTREYKEFKGSIAGLVGGDYKVNPKEIYKLTLVTGFSNKASDLDNAFKPLLDSMQLAMGFDDKQIYSIEAYKDVVKRGEEYLYILLETVPPTSVKVKITKLLSKLIGMGQ